MAPSRIRPRSTALAVAAFLVAPVCLATATAALAADMEARIDTAFPTPQPPYPDAAQVNGEQGNVILNVRVGANGKVRNVRVDQSSGFADLDNAAVEGVLSWHFLPAVEDGDTTSSWTKVKVVFQLPTAVVVPSAGSQPKPGPSH